MNVRRCLVPQCDSSDNARYDEDWVQNVVPGSISASSGSFQPKVCEKFIFNNDTTHETNETCPAHWFAHETERCDRWVFDKGERTIVNDVSGDSFEVFEIFL